MNTTVQRQPLSINPAFLALLLVLLPAVVWLASVGDFARYFTHRVPQGQLLYLFSKLAGLYAYFLMAIQVVIGVQGRRSRFFSCHPYVAAATTSAIIAHAALFITAASLRAGHSALDNLIPAFDQGFYKRSIGFGVLAAYVLLPVIAAGIWLRGGGLLSWIHRLAFVVAVLGAVHSISIGTETRSPAVLAFYATLVLWVVYSLFTHARARVGPAS